MIFSVPRVAYLGLFCLLTLGVDGGSVSSIHFRSAVTPPVANIPKELAKYEKPLRASLARLPEGGVLMAALTSGSGELGLNSKQVAVLQHKIVQTYAAISNDPAMQEVESVLAYCASTSKPAVGHYFLYRPDTVSDQTPCIVFLHGDGGNLLLYPWLWKQAFPDAVLLFPSWELSWEHGSQRYLNEMMSDVELRLGITFSQPLLAGVSSGGSGGLRLVNNHPNRFRGYVSISAAPSTDVVTTLHPSLPLRMIHGTQDPLLPINSIRKLTKYLSMRMKNFDATEVDGGHFILLTHRTEIFEAIRTFLSELE